LRQRRGETCEASAEVTGLSYRGFNTYAVGQDYRQ
jgi:hypothetical protein